jgi:hypothetical protein
MNEEVTPEEQANPEDEMLREEPAPVQIDPAPEEAPPESGFTNEHYGMGQMMGLSPAQVDAFNDPTTFEQVARSSIQHRNQPSQEPVHNPSVTPDGREIPYQAQSQQHQWTPEEIKSYQDQQQQAVKAHLDKTKFSFDDPDEFDESIVSMNDHYGERVGRMELAMQQLSTQNRQLMQREESRQADSVAREFDRICDSLPEDQYGRGPVNAMAKDQAMERFRLADAVSQRGHEYIDRREIVPSLDKLVGEVQDSSLKNAKSQVLKEVSEQSRQMATQSTAEPSYSTEGSVNGVVAAEKAVAEYYRDKGVPGGGSGDEFL